MRKERFPEGNNMDVINTIFVSVATIFVAYCIIRLGAYGIFRSYFEARKNNNNNNNNNNKKKGEE